MNAQARLTKIEAQVESSCPVCGTDRRDRRVREVEILVHALGNLWREFGRPPEDAIAWMREEWDSVIGILRRDPSLAAEAVARARADAPTEAELTAVAEKRVAFYQKHVTRAVALKLLREEAPELADLLAR